MGIALEQFTDLELLRVLIQRNKLQHAPYRKEFVTPHVEVLVGIGPDHTAEMILDEDAMDVLFEGIDWRGEA